jgi:general secretion pathway protein C
MFHPAPPPVPSATKPVDKASPGDALTNELKARIRKTGPKEYKVQREVVEKLLENPTLLMAHGQLVPAVETGGASALKLVGIKPDSLLGAIGLESGDRLLSINGVDITSPEKALSAYGRLSGAPHLTIAVARASGPTSLDYDIE